jgi:Arc/MetJ-type ribon-helix-helix transcriptional regulator
MTIHLSGQREQIVLSLMQAGKFTSPDEVIDEALRLVEQRYRAAKTAKEAAIAGGTALPEQTGQQLERLRRLGRKLEAMPTAAVTDGLSNRDHDRILYGP